METRVYHTVNCGLYFVHQENGIFIDGICRGRAYGYSDTPAEIMEQCRTRTGIFKALKALVFTHKHRDHFFHEDVRQVAQEASLLVYAPKYADSTIEEMIRTPEVSSFQIGSIKVYAIKTLHDGEAVLRAEPHVSFVINTPEETFFVAGDAVFRQGEAEKIDHYCDHWIDAAFVNAYQIMPVGDNLSFLRKLDPKKTVLIHKPFQKDDAYNIYKVFEMAQKRYPADLPEMICPAFESWIW